MKRYITVILFLASILVRGNNPPINFSNINNSDGLINNNINVIFKDRKGFMWFGTPYGLSRWDGYSFVNFTEGKEPHNLLQQTITTIEEVKDGNLWIMTGDYYSIYDYEKGIFEKNIEDKISHKPENATITKIKLDSDYNIWVLYSNSDLYKYESLDSFPKKIKPSSHKEPVVTNFFIEDDICWMLYSTGVIEGLNSKNLSREFYIDNFENKFPNLAGEIGLCSFNKEEIWLFAYTGSIGTYRINLKNNEILHLSTKSAPALSSNDVNSIVKDNDGKYWIGTNLGGLNILDFQKKTIQTINSDTKNSRSLCHDAITCLYQDRDEIMWIGSFKQGVSYYHKSIFKFLKSNDFDLNTSTLPFEDINCFAEEKGKALWIGSNGQGLVRYDLNDHSIKHYKHNPNNRNSLSSDIIISLTLDSRNRLWISTYLGGLNCLDGNKFTHFKNDPDDPYSIPSNSVWDFLEDNDGNYWVATFKGGARLYDEKKGFLPLADICNGNDINNHVPIHISQGNDDNVLISSCYGVYSVNYRSNSIDTICWDGENLRLSNCVVNSAIEDKRGLIWMGTENGLNVWDKSKDSLYIFFSQDGLPQNTVRSIVEDANGNMWLSTLKGLSKVSVFSKDDNYSFTFHNFTMLEGLQSDEFNQNSAKRLSNGNLIFGGGSGLNCFNPHDIISNKITSQPAFTELQLFGRSMSPSRAFKNHKILEKDICLTDSVYLTYNENDFSVEFSALSFFQPNKVNYQYKMAGYNNNWVTLRSGIREVSFTNMDPGEYTLYVKASNNDNIWNQQPVTLFIKVEPPFWQSGIAYFLYCIAFVLTIFLVQLYIRRRISKRDMMQQARIRHEMDEMRLKFFTNISHEFRSPLALMIAPIDNLMARKQSTEERTQLEILHRNSNELKLLVDKLLDFRRLDKGKLQLNAINEDIVGFIIEVARSFSNMAIEKNIHFSFKSTARSIKIPYDSEKMHRVMMNLLSNAFKFTPKDGYIEVMVGIDDSGDKNEIFIKVKDNGIGINSDDIPKIFDRFYQASLPQGVINHGSGIGLNMAKEYAEIHGGSLTVESKVNEGSEFTVHLPVTDAAEINPEENMYVVISDDSINGNNLEKAMNQDKLPLLLIADDNSDFRAIIRGSFNQDYCIIEASDGKQALQLTLDRMPDVVITDLMMPEMDGLEFCRAIRTDVRTSHIPVIILTAKNSEESMKEGFETGADYYMTKPINMELLKVRVQRISEQQKHVQKRMHNKVSNHLEIKGSEIQVRSLDEKLIEKAISIVETRMNDSDFSVEELSRELAMSRVYLYKKIVSLTGKSPIEFIRLIRLQRAAQLLQKSQLSVSEIAYQVGFNNPKYFTKYFKEEYKILPSEYAKLDHSVTTEA